MQVVNCKIILEGMLPDPPKGNDNSTDTSCVGGPPPNQTILYETLHTIGSYISIHAKKIHAGGLGCVSSLSSRRCSQQLLILSQNKEE